MKILLIEDSAVEARYLATMLGREEGVHLTVETTLQRGIDRALTDPKPDIVMLDLTLPDSDVETTLPQFVEQCPTVPVFVTTSTEGVELAEKLGYLGASGYALKKAGAKHIIHLLACAIGVAKRTADRQREKEKLVGVIEEQLVQIRESVQETIVPDVVPLKKEDGDIT